MTIQNILNANTMQPHLNSVRFSVEEKLMAGNMLLISLLKFPFSVIMHDVISAVY